MRVTAFSVQGHVTHQSRDHSIRHMPFPISGGLERAFISVTVVDISASKYI